MNPKVEVFKQLVPAPCPIVFSFFSDAHNLEQITPPWLNFKVLNMSSPKINAGTLIDYRLRLHGIPLKWQTLIERWEPGRCFVDTQKSGPFALWHHTHEFEDQGDRTLMIDTVRYALPFGVVGQVFGGWMVKRDVASIFEFRRQKIDEIFAHRT